MLLPLSATATAATQTTTDPDDPYEDVDYGVASDLLSLSWNSSSTPGKLVLDLAVDYLPNARFGAFVLIDTNLDDKADYTLEVLDYDYARNGYTDQEPTHHGAINENGHVRYALRHVQASTTDCQATQESGQGPETWGYDHAVAQTVDHDTSHVVLPLDLAALGNPASLRWAATSTSARGMFDGLRSYDYFPDATNGMVDDDGLPLDPRTQSFERDPGFCNIDGGHYGRTVRASSSASPARSRRPSTSRRLRPAPGPATRSRSPPPPPTAARSRATRGTSTRTASSTTPPAPPPSASSPQAAARSMGTRRSVMRQPRQSAGRGGCTARAPLTGTTLRSTLRRAGNPAVSS